MMNYYYITLILDQPHSESDATSDSQSLKRMGGASS